MSRRNNRRQQQQEENQGANAYRARREATIHAMRERGSDPYPHRFAVDYRIPDFVTAFADRTEATLVEDEIVNVAGRIVSIRGQGKLRFINLQGDGARLQVMSSQESYQPGPGDFRDIHSTIRRGDVIGICGSPCRSRNGELSITAQEIVLLAPCLHMVPFTNEHTGAGGITNQETRYRQRYLDLIVNQNVRRTFEVRASIIREIRHYLDDRQFIEVETPILNTIPGGAIARPFVTHHNELNMSMYLRVAPELYLKRLVIGGLDRVYEIGRQFRNEGMDLTHNPEFTTLESYQAYVDYEDLMIMSEELISGLVYQINNGSYVIRYSPRPGAPEIEIDFTPPFRRIPMLEGLENTMQTQLPALDDPDVDTRLLELLEEHRLNCEPPHTTARLLDTLVGEFLEANITHPTFITEHPQIMSPLAKNHRSRPFVTERFELFVAGRELANAYTELNDPVRQHQLFLGQAQANQSGDVEAMVVDGAYVTALEYGLPPTGGIGLGIDRLTMLLTNQNNIREVLLFPTMRPV